ncbi:MAG: TolC family protein [Planctomycetes bacterium]|nr:TolC family protein [Planctomycetota bacterium]
MPARLILIGSCLLIAACAAPWQGDDGRTGADPAAHHDSIRGQNDEYSSLKFAPTTPLQPIQAASYSSRRNAYSSRRNPYSSRRNPYSSRRNPHFDAQLDAQLDAQFDAQLDAQLDARFDARLVDNFEAQFMQARTVEELLRHAYEHHPMLRVRQHEIEAAQGRLAGAGELPNPELVFDLDRNVDDGTFQLNLRGDLVWETADKRWHREQLAAAGVTRAEVALNREAKAVLSRSAQAAVDVLYYKQLAQLYQRVGALAKKAAQWQKMRVDNGDVSALDGFDLQADAAEIEHDRLTALRQLKVAQVNLAQAIGMANPRPVEVAGRLVEEWLPDIPLEAVLDELRAGPELAEQQAAIRHSEGLEALEHANAIPNIEYGPRFSETFSDGAGSYGLRLRREIVINDRNQGGILASAAMIAREEAMLQAVSLETLGDAAAAFAELAPLRSQLESYTVKIKPLLDRTEQAVAKAINEKLIDPNDLITHIRRLVRLRVDHLRARYRYAQLHMRIVAASPTAIQQRRRAAGPN